MDTAYMTLYYTQCLVAAHWMWLFGRILPLIIRSKIPEDDKHWSNFLGMLEIVDRLFCPSLEDDAAYLQALIGDHYQEFCHLYSDKSVIPKMHFMVHMPRLMIQLVAQITSYLGSLNSFSCCQHLYTHIL